MAEQLMHSTVDYVSYIEGDNRSISSVAPGSMMYGGVMTNTNVSEEWTGSTIDPRCLELDRINQYRVIIDIFIVGLLCLGGLTGNTLAIVVLRVDCQNRVVSFLLQALAVSDNCYLIMCIFMQPLKALSDCTTWWPELSNTYPYVEQYVWPCASIAQTTTVWLVVLVTTDRYLAICKPFNTWRLTTVSRAKKAVTAIVVIAILYNVPRFFEQEVMQYAHPCKGNILRALQTPFRKSKLYFIVYKTCLYFLFRVLIPLGVLTVLNIKLVLALRNANRDHAVLTRSRPRTDSFGVILVAVVTVFILCQLPDFMVRLAITIMKFAEQKVRVTYINTITNLLLTINSSVNCIIYSLARRKFRKVLKRLFSRPCTSPSRFSTLTLDSLRLNGSSAREKAMQESTLNTYFNTSARNSPVRKTRTVSRDT